MTGMGSFRFATAFAEWSSMVEEGHMKERMRRRRRRGKGRRSHERVKTEIVEVTCHAGTESVGVFAVFVCSALFAA